MTALLHDVHWQAEKRKDYPEGVGFGEVLYADDTILIGTDPQKVQKVLQPKKRRSIERIQTIPEQRQMCSLENQE